MRESIKRVAPMVAIGSAYAGAGVFMFYAHKHNKANNIDINEWHPMTGSVYKEEKAARAYICPPFGGKCKSFNDNNEQTVKTEEQKSSVGKRM